MKKLITILLVAVLATSGCATVTFTDTGSIPTHEPSKKRWAHWFVANYFGPNKVEYECPAGQEVSASEVRLTAGTFFVGFFTIGIYSPRVIKYWCE